MGNPATIFISIASYRDPQLIPTLQDMLRHASQPERLHIAVCWQDDEDLSLFTRHGFVPMGSRHVAGHEAFIFSFQQARIELISVHYYASQGACWARSLAESLFEAADYFLQIDSHCRFIPGWDNEMITTLRQLAATSPRPVLSSYPPAFVPGEDEEASKKRYVSRLIFREFNPQGLPMFSSTPFESPEPVRGSYLAGGFIFTRGDFVKEIPNDPQIFFAGEEIAMAVRAFSHGYDIYHPHKPLLWHYYQRKEHSKVWGDHTNQAKEQGSVEKAWWERDAASKKRVRTVLGLESEPEGGLAPYGLGKIRTLAQFEYQAGICLKNGTVLPEVMAEDKVNFFSDPPADHAEWLRRQYAWHKKTLTLSKTDYEADNGDVSALHISVYTQQNELFHRQTLTRSELHELRQKTSSEEISLPVEFKTTSLNKPGSIRLCTWSDSLGWGTVTEKTW
ncbi:MULTISPECIES: GlcNAc-transferase family protein [unclassified Cedecea]|uniref:GlcNAc-transferase family protein n=1 Tax=unclassified Cedecea TaxID=2649846 RepID=UPI0030161F70